jgi:hypothetical protein
MLIVMNELYIQNDYLSDHASTRRGDEKSGGIDDEDRGALNR